MIKKNVKKKSFQCKIFKIYLSNLFAFQDDSVLKLVDCEFMQEQMFFSHKEVKQEMP